NRAVDASKPDETNPNANAWGDRRYARRTKQLADLFRSVWTGAGLDDPINTRVRVVLAGQAANLSRFDNEMTFLNKFFGAPKNYVYGIGIAPYFGLNKYTSVAGATKDQILEGMSLSVASY